MSSTPRDVIRQQAGLPSAQEPLAMLAQVPLRPALAPQVQLVGEMPETGFKERQWLVQRDGTFLQLTELLYRIAEHANGARTLEEIASTVTDMTDWMVSADNVRQLLQTKLIPLGLITAGDGAVVTRSHRTGMGQAPAPLRMHARMKVISPHLIDPLAKVLQVLYAPPVLIPLLMAIALAHGWVYFVHGVTGSLHAVLTTPGRLLIVLALMIMAGAFHELGHAAALRYGGGQVRGMGVGFYLIYPAFYTDVTESYRLGRWARVRTDLGGFYFYLIFTVVLVLFSVISGYEFLLSVVLLITLDILYQCLPFVRFDGYWALADLTGIPDLFSQMSPFLQSLRPFAKGKRSRLPALKPWVKGVFATYIILTIPVLALLCLLMVTRVPHLIIRTWAALLLQYRVFSWAQMRGDFVGMGAAGVEMLLLALLLLAPLYFLSNMGWRCMRTIWTWSKPTLMHLPTRLPDNNRTFLVAKE